MIVVDASVVAVALLDDGEGGSRVRERLADETLAAPEIMDLEVLSMLRRIDHRGVLTARRAALAMTDLADLAVRRTSHTLLLPRCWELRGSVSPYDAAYVALAEVLDVPLYTADRRLARASGPRCHIEVPDVL